MILAIILGSVFYQTARRKDLNPILWAILGALGYFGGQVLAVLIVGMIDSYILSFKGAQIGIGIGGGILAVLILAAVQSQVAKRKKLEKTNTSADLLDDDQYLERL